MNINQGALVGKRLGKYELLALLAIGGTAEIYLARIGGEAGFEKYVVVKCLLDHLADESDYVKMFLDEARLGAQLDHSNIVQTLELGENEGRYYMAMEYLSGMSLAQLARKTNQRVAGGKLPPELVLGMASQVCAGLHYAHRKQTSSGQPLNLVHRDISPQNLVVSFEGLLKIVDFGIAKADVRDTHTRSGTIKGKFAYMSPEQCLAKTVDHRTDIFALGVILHELLTARRLFKRTTTYETYEAIIKGKVPKPSEVAPEIGTAFDDVVMRALQYRKEDRWEDAETMGQALLGTLHRQGKSVNAADLANFYEAHFEAELKEYSDRMRMLITGKRKQAVGDESINWGSDEIDGGPPEEESEIAIDLEGSMIESIESIAMSEAVEPLAAAATIEHLEDIGHPGDEHHENDTIDPDEPVGATRVEANPMALLEAARDSSQTIDVDATHVQPETTTPNPRPAGPGGRTIAPGGGAPLPRASEMLRSKSTTSGPSAKTIGPGQMMMAPKPPQTPDDESGPRGRGKKESRQRPTLNLKPNTNPGQGADDGARKTVMGISAQSPVAPRERPASQSGPAGGRPATGAESSRGSSGPSSATFSGGGASAGTASVSGAVAVPESRQRPASASPSARTLYHSPPVKDPAPPSNQPAGTGARPAAPPARNRPPTSAPPQSSGATGPSAPTMLRPQTSAPVGPPVPPDTLPPNQPSPLGDAAQASMQSSGGMHPMQPSSSHGGQFGQRADGPRRHHGHQSSLPSMPMGAPRKLAAEPWFIGLVFIVSLGIGLGATLLFASL